MALQMPTNIMPDSFSGVGGANFDATQGLNVSWQVSGSPFLIAYQISICAMDDNSTQLYTTGKLTLPSPFYGVLANGTVQFFNATPISASVLSSNGIVNGNEYKMYITQWWGDTDSESITQQSASVIRALSTPSVSIDEYPAIIPSRMFSFSATYTQNEGDEIAWVRWILTNLQTEDVIADTGEVYGTSQLEFDYDAFFSGTLYGLEIRIETQYGQTTTSGVQQISVSYNVNPESGLLTAVQQCEWNGVSVSWAASSNPNTTGYSLYRLDNITNRYQKVVDLGVNQTGIVDYSAKNGHTYTYQLWETGDDTFVQQPITSNPVTPCRWNVLLVAADEDINGIFHPQNVYVFGSSVETGEESNNSKSSIIDTFSGYPAYQQSSNNYRTGKISAFIGKIDPETNQYTNDTSDYMDELMLLSKSNLTLFMRDRKGNFRQIKINGSITQKVQFNWPNQAAVVTIPWVEVADASTVSVILTNEDALWPYDEVADTTVDVDPFTGVLNWTIDDDYLSEKKGSVLTVDNAGHMIQAYNGTNVQMADMSIDVREHLISDQ